MNPLSDHTLDHLRQLTEWPDLPDDRYRVLEPIGRGGMSTVYRAHDTLLGRDVALKVLRPDLAGPEFVARLRREARILAALEHPGIVPVHDVGALADGRVYYVMQLVRGTRLDQHLGPETGLGELLRLFERICQAVAFAHAHGVIHRDLKPVNVMIGAFGEVLVLDWGVAKLRHDPAEPGASAPAGAIAAGEDETQAGTVLGTPGFMAPEQVSGTVDRIDERTDVFGLGALLRRMLEGRGALPKPLVAIVRRATAPDPAARYATADALRQEVRRYQDGEAVGAYREGPVERARRLFLKYRTPILLIAAYLAMRILILLWRGI